MELIKKSTCIFGIRGSGKSTMAHFIASLPQYRAIIYDTIWEFPINHNQYDVYRPHDRQSKEELVNFIKTEIKGKYKYNLLLIDESNRFVPGGGRSLDKDIIDLNDIQRHRPYSIGTIWIARRPTQIHPDIVGLADNIICFMLTGKNDIKYLNDIKSGLGDEVSRLKQFQAIAFSHGQLIPMDIVTPDDIWKKRRE